jgi:putative transcriptional regulator
MEKLPYSQIQKGTFLIATPEIDSGIFFRSVILVCEHNISGSFGIIINKSLDLQLPEEILSIKNLANNHISIRAGGPVQANQMMLLHNSDKIPGQTLELCNNVYLGGDLQFLQESVTKENGPHICLCFGYAGWGTGQLEREFLDGSWFLHPATFDLIFKTPCDKLWQILLRQMGGKYATMSMIPEDLSLN